MSTVKPAVLRDLLFLRSPRTRSVFALLGDQAPCGAEGLARAFRQTLEAEKSRPGATDGAFPAPTVSCRDFIFSFELWLEEQGEDLATLLTEYYTRFAPSKLGNVPKIAESVYGQGVERARELSSKLEAQYGTALLPPDTLVWSEAVVPENLEGGRLTVPISQEVATRAGFSQDGGPSLRPTLKVRRPPFSLSFSTSDP